MDAFPDVHPYLFTIGVGAGVWTVATLFAYVTVKLVARYNYFKYDAQRTIRRKRQ